MREKLISIETAKILHDLNISGFDEATTVYVMWSKDCDYKTKIPFEPKVFLNGNYYEDFEYNLEEFKEVFKEGKKYLEIQFPTQSLLKKWLREVHNIDVDVFRDSEVHFKDETKWIVKVSNWNDIKIFKSPIADIKHPSNWHGIDFKSYEEAFEKGLFNALKLVKSAKEKN